MLASAFTMEKKLQEWFVLKTGQSSEAVLRGSNVTAPTWRYGMSGDDLKPFIEATLQTGEYLGIHVEGQEWMYVMYKLIKDSFTDSCPPEGCAAYPATNGVWFLFRKKFVDAEAFSKALGCSAEEIEGSVLINLQPLTPEFEVGDLPLPNVTDWGEG